jgi:hypothetical protein
MAEGQVIKEEDKLCPGGGKHFAKIRSRDNLAAELECECGRSWTAYFQKEPE